MMPIPFSARPGLARDLASLAIFEGVPRAGLSRIARQMRRRCFSSGATIYRQGDPAQEFFVLTAGRITITVEGGDPEVPPVAVIDAPHWFGELAALTESTRFVTITALTDSEAWELPRSRFEACISKYPVICRNLIVSLSKQIQKKDRDHVRQASLAIERVRLLDDLQQRNVELAALIESTRAVIEPLDLDRSLEAITAQAALVTRSDAACIFLYHPDCHAFKLRASYNTAERYIQEVGERPMPPDGTPSSGSSASRSLVVRCATERVPVQIADVAATSDYPSRELLLQSGYRSVLVAPLLHGRQLIGIMSVLRSQPQEFSAHEVKMVTTFASHSAIALDHARLFHEVEARNRDLVEALEQQIRLSLLIDSAMDAIIEVDASQAITMLNPAAEKLFGCSATEAQGTPLKLLLGDETVRRLSALDHLLQGRADAPRHGWVPGPFLVTPSGRDPFPAEATLSGYEAQGKRFSTIILRNMEELTRAEARIESLSAQTEYLIAEIEADHGFDEIIGQSPALRAALTAVSQVASTDATVLILGETGTGKELFARAIHKRSPRHDGPLVKVNCAAVPATLIESEFFGHEKGAFTGATGRRDGRFALADGGTIFLDEIGELPLELQGRLLRILQEGEFEPVGGSKTRKVDVRVIAATNRDLERAVQEGGFREDLYYRLSVFPLRLPPLRERGDDVVLLAEDLIKKLARRMGYAANPLTPADAALLRSFSWPGNVRELRNVIERALITSAGGPLRLGRVLSEGTPAHGTGAAAEAGRPRTVLDERQLRAIERANMIAALEQTGWRVGGEGAAASILGISPSTFKSRMKSLGIRRQR